MSIECVYSKIIFPGSLHDLDSHKNVSIVVSEICLNTVGVSGTTHAMPNSMSPFLSVYAEPFVPC